MPEGANRRGGKTENRRRDVARSSRSCRFCGEPGGKAHRRCGVGATSYANRTGGYRRAAHGGLRNGCDFVPGGVVGFDFTTGTGYVR